MTEALERALIVRNQLEVGRRIEESLRNLSGGVVILDVMGASLEGSFTPYELDRIGCAVRAVNWLINREA